MLFFRPIPASKPPPPPPFIWFFVCSVSVGGTTEDALLEGLKASRSLLAGEGLRRCADTTGGLKLSVVLDANESLRDCKLGLVGTAVARVSALIRGDESVR